MRAFRIQRRGWPPVCSIVMPTRSVTITTSDDLRLEGRLTVPDGPPAGGVVVCHPHPQYGGTMSSGMIPDVWRAMARRGWASLRFNFRGAGRSEGRYERGIGELKDVAAALDLIAEEAPGTAIACVGWSFGSLVALAGAVAHPDVTAYVGIAPPVVMSHEIDLPALPPAERLDVWQGRALAVCGTEDPFCRPNALARWIEAIPGARMQVFDGEDHFFSTARVELAATVADFLEDG